MPDTRQYDAGSPGTGKSHLAVALGVEAIKAGRSVYFSTLADLIASLAKAEREGTLRERIRFLSAFALLIVDEIGYLPVVPGGGNLFFQLINARYEKGAMILTSNRGFAEWGEVFGEPNTAGCRHRRRGRVSRHGDGSASRPLRAAAFARAAPLRARTGLCCC